MNQSDAAKKYTTAEIDRIKNDTDLVALIGASVALKRNGEEFKGLCPFHNETTASFHVIPKKRIYYCFGCKAKGDALSWLMHSEKISFAEAIKKLDKGYIPAARRLPDVRPAPSQDDEAARQKKIEKAQEIWKQAVPAPGTIVEKYLISRGLRGVCLPKSLRYHPKLWNSEKSDLMPAMVAAVLDKEARRIIAIHRTYLKPDGSGKADLQSSKMILGPYRGGHVHLDMQVADRLAIAEGIETALSVKKAVPILPVWAALSLGNMDAPIPDTVTELILCADADNKDQQSADKILAAAVKLFERTGRIIRIARPTPGKDFNDMMRAG
jgi:DNA primase